MKRIVLVVVVAVVLVLGLSGVALAATPTDIYNDYIDNGVLDEDYTVAELQAYLADAYVHQYGDPDVVTDLDALVTAMLTPPSDDDEFPMTGAQLTLLALGAVGIGGLGFGLRRLARSRG